MAYEQLSEHSSKWHRGLLIGRKRSDLFSEDPIALFIIARQNECRLRSHTKMRDRVYPFIQLRINSQHSLFIQRMFGLVASKI